MNILIYLILLTVLFSVFIYIMYNHSLKYKDGKHLIDVESDNIDIVESEIEPPVDYDILNQIPEKKGLDVGIEHFYDPENVTFPSPISQGDIISNGRNCHWKMYKKPNYYGWGPWGKFHYGEPYYMKLRCEGDTACTDDLSVNLNCLNKIA